MQNTRHYGSLSHRLITLLIVLVSLVFILSISRSIYTLWQKGDIVSERESELTRLKEEHGNLQKELGQVQSPDFIEKQAREKLNLERPGEVTVVLPQNLKQSPIEEKRDVSLPNWQRWWKLFF